MLAYDSMRRDDSGSVANDSTPHPGLFLLLVGCWISESCSNVVVLHLISHPLHDDCAYGLASKAHLGRRVKQVEIVVEVGRTDSCLHDERRLSVCSE